ncbi:MAG: SUMF1/EgtB/PvdO family nonheme iron enzyme [Spirochaetales bacterium]|jgi:formylglycine-generating enzyme required for sulfatase activity|nr:SUMF1/EgtB/PvdO family nonheme iron enzyme [Spirochaetales bacterium]
MKKKMNKSPENGERVILKPVFGIQPRVYVGALYGIGLAVLAFFLLLEPGLSSPGAKVTVTSLPEGASVLLDGIRIGSTPLTAFIAEGDHTLTLRRPFFEERSLPLAVESRLFASRFFPKKQAVHENLALSSAEELLTEAHREFSARALMGEGDPLSPFPPVLSEAVLDYALSPAENAEAELFSMLSSALASVNSPAGFRDFIRAGLLAASGGSALSPQSLVKAASWFLSLYGEKPEALYWLILVLPPPAREELLASAWTQERLTHLAAEEKKPPFKAPPPPFRRVSILGSEYVLVPKGSFRMGGPSSAAFSRTLALDAKKDDSFAAALRRLRENPPYSVWKTLPRDFFLQTREVTQAEYAAFVRENPAWTPANRNVLAAQGLAEESYLASWGDSPAPPQPDYPASEISWYAAQAYCGWLASKDTQYAFFLPDEAAWEYAARLNLPPDGKAPLSARQLAASGDAAAGNAGLKFMLGNLWEWCGGPYAPASSIFPPAGDSFPPAERAVRGGSWVNSPGSVGPSTRASQPPEWCSPYTGFRVAAVRTADLPKNTGLTHSGIFQNFIMICGTFSPWINSEIISWKG